MKKTFNITPFVSVGDVIFGMDRDVVRNIFGDFLEYKCFADDLNTADCFDICIAHYDMNNKIDFISFHDLNNVELNFGQTVLTSMNKEEIIKFCAEQDKNLMIEDYGYGVVSVESNEIGVACYFETDTATDENGNRIVIDKVATISFAIKDFWK